MLLLTIGPQSMLSLTVKQGSTLLLTMFLLIIGRQSILLQTIGSEYMFYTVT